MPDDKVDIFFGVVWGFLLGLIIWGATYITVTDSIHNQLNNKNLAHWEINPVTGERSFVIECSKCK